jgi:hypothetical protein
MAGADRRLGRVEAKLVSCDMCTSHSVLSGQDHWSVATAYHEDTKVTLFLYKEFYVLFVICVTS